MVQQQKSSDEKEDYNCKCPNAQRNDRELIFIILNYALSNIQMCVNMDNNGLKVGE